MLEGMMQSQSLMGGLRIANNIERILNGVGAGLPAVQVHFPLTDNDPNTISFVKDNQLQRRPLAQPAKYEPGFIAEKAWVVQKSEQPAFADLGDFEKDQPFSVSFGRS